MKRIVLSLALCIIAASAWAQAPVLTQPYPIPNSTNNSGAITATGTYQSIWAAVTSTRGRANCVIQNNSSRTMFVFFGPIASASPGNSVNLSPAQSVTCIVGGIVLQDQVSIRGTQGDGFFAAQQ